MIGLLENGPHLGMEAVARAHQIKIVEGSCIACGVTHRGWGTLRTRK